MALSAEIMFTEVMRRAWERHAPYAVPWWVQQTLSHPVRVYDQGLFDSPESAFASNALYRYWNMIGVKDHGRESLIGQFGEIEPVYEAYLVQAFLFDPASRALTLPGALIAGQDYALPTQALEDGYLPTLRTSFSGRDGVTVEQTACSTTVGDRQRDLVLLRLAVVAAQAPADGWLGLAVLPAGPSSFQRHDRAGRYVPDRQISFLRYNQAETRIEVNNSWGPVFDTPPARFGLYGHPDTVADPEHYLAANPFHDLVTNGGLNGADTATDHLASMCTAAFAWPFDLVPGARLDIDIRLPVDDYRGGDDLAEIRRHTATELSQTNRDFWVDKLNRQGLQMELPNPVSHLFDLFRLCRANLLILADGGEIHSGPTIYDSFWVRDSSVEGIACALAGDSGVAATQFGDHYPKIFNHGYDRIGPVSAHGFFGGEHEKNDQEWDSNGQALWALGRFDRISGPAAAFGARMYWPYILEGARWIRDNRSSYGLFHNGWSAEHLGDKGKPDYWDDMWGIAGLYEAARLAERLGAAETAELWDAYHQLRQATVESILWVLDAQRANGAWETFIPTGPADVGRLDSSLIGAVAYFHPCRLHINEKLGPQVDVAARLTLETIWSHFVDGGFPHDAAWLAYGPYLTLQLAHAFLLVGDLGRMDACLSWVVGNAGYASGSAAGPNGGKVRVVQGAWNEQHAYAVASDFTAVPDRWWYMGDIPHGWAAAEYNLLLRDITFFEADEDGTPHVFLAPGVLPHWLADSGRVSVSRAPTSFGTPFGFTLYHDADAKTVTIEVTEPLPENVSFIYPCRFGTPQKASCDGHNWVPPPGDISLPAGMHRAVISYA